MSDSEGILARDKEQLILIYNGNSRIGQVALGYAQASEDDVQTIDVSKTNLGDTVWVDIATGLGLPMSKVLSPEHPDAPDVDEASFDTDDWLKVLQKNPDVFQKPIAIKGDRFQQLDTGSEISQFIEVDSAGLEKSGIGEPPTTQSTTEGENFVDKD